MAEHPIRLLVLDVNGVLYRYDVERRIALLAERTGVTPDAVRAEIFESGLEDRADAGDIGPDEYLAQASRGLGIELDRETWAGALRDAVEPDEAVLAVVRDVAAHTTTTTLSNNGLLVRELHDDVYPALDAIGLEFHVAAEFGESKPDVDVYLDVCARFGVDPAAAAFVDDKRANADGAARAGLAAHHFTGLDGLVSFLDRLGLRSA